MFAGFVTAPVWAVHLAEGVLTAPWLLGGFGLAAVLACAGAIRVREEEVPRIALLTAVFFIASLIHVRLGPTTAHLLLNGLVGAVLGWRAALAIPVGLFLQAAFIGHGAFSTLGVNSCVLVLPALFAGLGLRALGRWRWHRHPWGRAAVVALCAAACLAGLAYGVGLLAGNGLIWGSDFDLTLANRLIVHPATLAGIALLSAGVAWAEGRLDHPPEFPLGLLMGVLTTLATLALNSLALVAGGAADFHSLAVLVFLAHLPVAVIEGIILGFTVSFLARIRPDLLGIGHYRVASGSSGNTSSSGTSH